MHANVDVSDKIASCFEMSGAPVPTVANSVHPSSTVTCETKEAKRFSADKGWMVCVLTASSDFKFSGGVIYERDFGHEVKWRHLRKVFWVESGTYCTFTSSTKGVLHL